MWSCVIVCMLLVGAMAQTPPSQEQHEPCCAPKNYTYKEVDIMTSASDGVLVVEYERSQGAYDAVSEQLSLFLDVDYFNGTELHGRYIAEFKERVLYIIIMYRDEEHCFPSKLDFGFPKDCIPDDAKFLQDAWVGEQDLRVDSWYYSRQIAHDKEAHIVTTVGTEDCVPISLIATQVNTATGETIEVVDARFLDFSLGIYDREHYFKIPESCQPDNASKEPTLAEQKIMDKISRGRKLLGL